MISLLAVSPYLVLHYFYNIIVIICLGLSTHQLLTSKDAGELAHFLDSFFLFATIFSKPERVQWLLYLFHSPSSQHCYNGRWQQGCGREC